MFGLVILISIRFFSNTFWLCHGSACLICSLNYVLVSWMSCLLSCAEFPLRWIMSLASWFVFCPMNSLFNFQFPLFIHSVCTLYRALVISTFCIDYFLTTSWSLVFFVRSCRHPIRASLTFILRLIVFCFQVIVADSCWSTLFCNKCCPVVFGVPL